MEHFYLGTSEDWLGVYDVPLMVSFRNLRRRLTFKPALDRWVLDSGGFTELSLHGMWTTTAYEFIADVRRIVASCGMPDWIAPQDWMCEPGVRATTGLSVTEHQRLTVANFVHLRELAPDLPIAPVLQGWDLEDYQRCRRMYEDAGVDLLSEEVVGLGTVCRRQSTQAAEAIVVSLAPLRLHGFGVKVTGLRRYGYLLSSADSQAWGYGPSVFRSRREDPTKPPRCIHQRPANHCALCAIEWRGRIIEESLTRPYQTHLTDAVARS